MNFTMPLPAEMYVLVDMGYRRVLMFVLVHQIAVPMRVGVPVSWMGVLVGVDHNSFFFLLVAVRHPSSPPPWKLRYRPSVASPKAILGILPCQKQP
ncbi:hypothetical protein [Ammonifex thiophilus]|uniref:Uncharacterized protein n=1 Tax=Ammonifex thiophilus TaxID=444093 RepID=A0A3D8P6Z7_9THEO|nr:hypothetical protein [Ammonifex thiophilus]RDV84008.1 hypothetical protein DXX99_04025 [Ammonifex thiophilus]